MYVRITQLEKLIEYNNDVVCLSLNVATYVVVFE